MDDEEKVRKEIEERKLKLMESGQKLEERKVALEEKGRERTESIEKKQLRAEGGWFSKQGKKIHGEGFSGILIVLGIVFHLIHGIMTNWDYSRLQVLLFIEIFFGITIVILSGLGDRNKLAKNALLMAIILSFEWFYYDIINIIFTQATVPYFLAKIFWNGWIIAGAFTGYNTSKLAKFFGWVIALFIILNLFVYLPIEKFMIEKTANIGPKEVGSGFVSTVTQFTDEIACSMGDPNNKEICLKEKEWSKGRAGDDKINAMKETCKQDIAKCDCYVYPAGKERDDCLKNQAEARLQQRTAATKELTQTKLDFEGDATKQTYEKIVGVNPRFTLISPYKELDISIDCSIKNSSKAEIGDSFEIITILKERTKTSTDVPYTRNIECMTSDEVPKGEYTFELSASLSNVATSTSYVGLYTDPEALYNYDTKNPDSILKASYDNQIKNKDKFPTGKVESVSDPDLVLLSFYIEPVETREVKGLDGLVGMKAGNYFNLRIAVKNNKAGSNITGVESLEFEIPNIFDVECNDVYDTTPEGNIVRLTAKADKLKAAGIEKITYGKEGKLLLGLSCKLKGNIDMPNLANPYEFKGIITYSQLVTKTFKVTQLV